MRHLIALLLLVGLVPGIAAIDRSGIPVVRAQVFNVPDGDVDDLRDAIAEANTNGAHDVITLAEDGFYDLDDGPFEADGPNGLPSIVADGGHTLTVEGNGATIQRAEGAQTLFRLFHVAPNSELILKEITLANGNVFGLPAFDNEGGAILNTGRLTLVGATLGGNTATRGGAVANIGGILAVSDNSIFDQNAADAGGALFAAAPGTSTTISGSLFINNAAAATPSSIGGAILNRATLSTSDTRFQGNLAEDAGAALYNDIDGETTISGGYLRSNEGPSAMVIDNRGSLEIDGTDISENPAGGINNQADTDGQVATLLIENATLASNGSRAVRSRAFSSTDGSHEVEVGVRNTTFSGHSRHAIESLAYGDDATTTARLTVVSSTFEENDGGIRSEALDPKSTAFLTVIETTLSGQGDRAGVDTYGDNSGQVFATLSAVTISGGGDEGVAAEVEHDASSSLRVYNSTISGNQEGITHEAYDGASAELVLASVTVAGNSAEGLLNVEASTAGEVTLDVSNTVIAASGEVNCDVTGTVTAGPSNVSDDASCADQGFTQVEDVLLGALAENGGPTSTHLPLEGSPLVDAGLQERCDDLRFEAPSLIIEGPPIPGPPDEMAFLYGLDQRRGIFYRTSGPMCDVGAVEVQQMDGPAPGEMAPRGYAPVVARD